MADLSVLSRFQRIVFSRLYKTDTAGKAEQYFVAWLLFVITVRFCANTWFAFTVLLEGKTDIGLSFVIFNFFHLLLFWVFIPPVVTGSMGKKAFLAPQCFLFPLSQKEVFVSCFYGIVFQPVYLFLGIVSITGLIPMALLANPVFPVTCGICGVFFFASVSVFLSFLFILISQKSGSAGIFPLLFKAVLCLILFANFTFFWGGEHVVVLVFGKAYTLFSPQGNSSFVSSLSFLHALLSPETNVTFPDSLLSYLIPLTLAVIVLSLTFLLSARITPHPEREPHKKTAIPVFSGLRKTLIRSRMTLLRKELISFVHTIDFRTGFFIAAVTALYLSVTPRVNHELFILVVALFTIITSPFFLNSFGNDRTAFGRYLLFPVTPGEVISAKNRAAFIICGVPLFVLLILHLFKSGNVILTLYYTAITVCIMLFYCLAGNMISIMLPKARHYANFSHEGSGGAGAALLAVLCWAVPFQINTILDGDFKTGCLVYSILSVVLLMTIIAANKKMAVLFGENADSMRESLSV